MRIERTERNPSMSKGFADRVGCLFGPALARAYVLRASSAGILGTMAALVAAVGCFGALVVPASAVGAEAAAKETQPAKLRYEILVRNPLIYAGGTL
jgi:hypothetical protein